MTRLDSQRWQGRTRTACLVYLQAAAGQRAPGSARLIMSGKGISHQPITGLLPRPPARAAADDGYSASMSAAITSHAIVHRLKLPLCCWLVPSAAAANSQCMLRLLPTRALMKYILQVVPSTTVHSTIIHRLYVQNVVTPLRGHCRPRPGTSGRARISRRGEAVLRDAAAAVCRAPEPEQALSPRSARGYITIIIPTSAADDDP